MIEKITAQEFEYNTKHKKTNAVVFQEELRILMDLQDGEAIKFPCKPAYPRDDSRWHGSRCQWSGKITREAKKHGVHVKAKCVRNVPVGVVEPQAVIGGGTMYVLRVRSISEESHAS